MVAELSHIIVIETESRQKRKAQGKLTSSLNSPRKTGTRSPRPHTNLCHHGDTLTTTDQTTEVNKFITKRNQCYQVNHLRREGKVKTSILNNAHVLASGLSDHLHIGGVYIQPAIQLRDYEKNIYMDKWVSIYQCIHPPICASLELNLVNLELTCI